MSLEKFKTVTLADVSLNNKGEYGIGASAVDYSDDLYTYLRITDINDDGTLNIDDLKSVDDEDAKNYLLKENDVVFARTGNSTGKAYYYNKMDGELVYAGFLIKFSLDPKKINPKFIKYYVLSEEYKGWVNSMCTGSTRPNINAKMYGNMEFLLPPREQQDFLVNILDEIDKKIEINKRINKNLDTTIRTLYNAWFVNFLPFQNQEFKDTYMGKIPKDWEIKNLNEICDKISESYKPDSDEVVLIQTSDVSKGKVLNHEKVPNDNYKGHFKYKFEKNDILYTQIRPKNERYAFINFNPINYVASTQLMVLRAKPKIILPYILYLFLTSRNMIMEVNLLAESRSGTFPQINFNEIKHEKVIVAPFEVYENFWNIIKSLVEKKFIIDKEIIKLTQLRDTLLPKLMSGEIDVSKINCDLKYCNKKLTLTLKNKLTEALI